MVKRTLVFGPAYLDRVLRIDRPLHDPDSSEPLDQSVDGRLKFGVQPPAQPSSPLPLTLTDPSGSQILASLPAGWPGPYGEVELARTLQGPKAPWVREVRGVEWSEDLGGMGAGYATALGGKLVSALGDEHDPMSQSISSLLAAKGVNHLPVRISGQPADWTLLLSSGAHGDKLPIGFRGCHAAITSLSAWVEEPCELRVVTSLPNPLVAQALEAGGDCIRFFAPSMRNMVDLACPISSFVRSVDILCCNRHEWEQLEDRESVAWSLSLLVVTNGAHGGSVRFTNPQGDPGEIQYAAFPRNLPPRDTNRAGEAFASTLLSTLLRSGWTPGVSEAELVQTATLRASAAAALVLDRLAFEFPSDAEIDRAVAAGLVS